MAASTYKQSFETTINGKTIKGWFGVLRKGGRKFGGFALFQSQRQIQGFPKAFKPKAIFGGVDDEGANNLVVQRLTGLIEFDPAFQVSHTKVRSCFRTMKRRRSKRFWRRRRVTIGPVRNAPWQPHAAVVEGEIGGPR